MKKLLIVALCATALMLSCKSKGKVEGPTKADTIAAVIDSIIEENDTTPMPMFIMGTDGEGYLQVLYWSHIEEPQKTDDNDSWYEEYRQSWGARPGNCLKKKAVMKSSPATEELMLLKPLG